MSRIATTVASIAWVTLARMGAPGQARAPGPDSIRVEILDLHSSEGTVYCTIYAAPGDGFPVSPEKALQSAKSRIEERKAHCEFNRLAVGVYAVGMIHDENDNKKLDTNWIGLPAEGYGTSRDAKAMFGPPHFKDAAFTYSGGSVRVPIHVRY